MSIVEQDNIKAICLDIDGTLYPKFQMNLRLILTAFPNIKLGLSFNKVRKLYRSTQELEKPITQDREGFLDKQAKIYLGKTNPTDKELDKVKNAINKQFYLAWEKSFMSIKAYDNMLLTLQKAKDKGLKIALLSDFPIAEKVQTLGLENIVDFAISSEETGYLKPSLNTFLQLSNGINIDPKNCIYFGDSYNKDIIGANNAGMKTLYISNKKDKAKFKKANYICKDWYEIESLLL
ncbi:MAG: HAD family hydrolase [Pleomorphochaeta sp.]